MIAGEIGSGALGYTAIGEHVGMAQRMESVAPPGGVMLSASTARLVDGSAALGEPQMVRIKGADEPVRAHRLLGIGERHHTVGRAESTLVGRRREMSAVEGLLDRAIDGHGAVVGVVGSPGIGKSRLVREVAAMAAARGVDVFTAFCESHASDIPFRVVARLLRAATGVGDLDASAARRQVRARVPDAEPEDLLLFDDLLGIADPEVALPKISGQVYRPTRVWVPPSTDSCGGLRITAQIRSCRGAPAGGSGRTPDALAPSASAEAFDICPSGMSGVSTADTSCAFADGVRWAWYSQPGTIVTAYSPVTGLYYTMQCTPTATTFWYEAKRCVGVNSYGVGLIVFID